VNYKSILLAAAVLASGIFVLVAQQPGQEPAPPEVFTAAQAEAGRKAYENTCGNCHTPSLRGRKGDPGELPPVSSIPAYMQDMARGIVPPLAGADFMGRWGSNTAAQLIERIEEAVGAFPPEGTNIPVPGHAPAASDPTSVNITAYVLQVNGAKAGTQPLTKTTTATTAAIVNSVTTDRR
jgi:mono/diheme cytochrome c family protein